MVLSARRLGNASFVADSALCEQIYIVGYVWCVIIRRSACAACSIRGLPFPRIC